MATKTLTLRMDEGLLERIDAVVGDRTRNAAIKDLIEAGLRATSEEEEARQSDEAKAAATYDTLLEKIADLEKKVDGAGEQITGLKESVDGAGEKITRDVVDGVSEQNNALFRDTTTQMTTAVLPQLNEMNRKLLDQLDERIGEMREQPIALPESQVQVEGETVVPALPAETPVEEVDPSAMGFFDKRAYDRMKAHGYRVIK